MPLLPFLAWFASGAFLINAIPHLVAGLQGRPFQSPFAKPPGRGLSSPSMNILWSFINLGLGWGLVTQVGNFDIHRLPDAIAFFGGALAMGLLVSRYFGRLCSADGTEPG